jgi:hypothetical protein
MGHVWGNARGTLIFGHVTGRLGDRFGAPESQLGVATMAWMIHWRIEGNISGLLESSQLEERSDSRSG